MSLETASLKDSQAKTIQAAVTGLSDTAQSVAGTADKALTLMGSWGQLGAVGVLGSVTFVLVVAGLIVSYLGSKADREQHANDIKMTVTAQHANVETLAKSQEKQIEQISKTWEAQTKAMTQAVEMNTKSVEKLAEKIDRGQQAVIKTLGGDGK